MKKPLFKNLHHGVLTALEIEHNADYYLKLVEFLKAIIQKQSSPYYYVSFSNKELIEIGGKHAFTLVNDTKAYLDFQKQLGRPQRNQPFRIRPALFISDKQQITILPINYLRKNKKAI